MTPANGFSYFPGKIGRQLYVGITPDHGKQLAVSYGVTIFITVGGTFIGLFVMSMFAYSSAEKGFA